MIALLTAVMIGVSGQTPDPIETYIYQKCSTLYSPDKSREKARYYTPMIKTISKKHRVNPQLTASLIWAESQFNPREISPAGALGLTQVMPFWFDHFKISRSHWSNPQINLDTGLRIYAIYRSQMQKRYPGITTRDLQHRTLVAYNMGERAVISRGITRSRYSRKVLRDLP